MVLLLGRVQKSSQSRKQTASQHSSSERKCVFRRFRKAGFREMFWFCIHLVHCETAAHFLVISSILNNEVGKLTGEHCVHD